MNLSILALIIARILDAQRVSLVDTDHEINGIFDQPYSNPIKIDNSMGIFKQDYSFSHLGYVVKISGAPYQVDFECTGTLISNEYVVTSASCLEQGRELLPAKSLIVTMPFLRTRISFKVESLIVHQDYNNYTLANDIALLKFGIKFNFLGKLPKIYASEVDINMPFHIYGYNLYSFTPRVSGPSQRLLLQTNAKKENDCSEIMLDEGRDCTTLKNDESICINNRGGPVLTSNPEKMLVGIVSTWASTSKSSQIPKYSHHPIQTLFCSKPGDAVVYTLLHKYIDWISSQTNISSDHLNRFID
ncbi:Transmembrane protease serine 11F [Smittium mucronatum]|uniref:Transmembrane protease serine 11F n=1 Tax=Smittium mucronatum TaxID=133383 RepID=A0A1R0GNH3_9FUNG|nr:Transmembrane protease serine 11F [Smittium mucronatum]OLY79499.1 Transmembrane protease serine 11F [Smittium mucronatum]